MLGAEGTQEGGLGTGCFPSLMLLGVPLARVTTKKHVSAATHEFWSLATESTMTGGSRNRVEAECSFATEDAGTTPEITGTRQGTVKGPPSSISEGDTLHQHRWDPGDKTGSGNLQSRLWQWPRGYTQCQNLTSYTLMSSRSLSADEASINLFNKRRVLSCKT